MTDETKAPDVSVVIPCYNAERWVGRAIESVLAQEGVTVEVIVIDDGSTDGSVDVLRRYEDRIHWETDPNRGACAARNRGLALARADYVMFLDADDYLLPACLSELRRQSALDDADAAVGSAYSEQVGGRRKKMKGPKSCIKHRRARILAHRKMGSSICSAVDPRLYKLSRCMGRESHKASGHRSNDEERDTGRKVYALQNREFYLLQRRGY